MIAGTDDRCGPCTEVDWLKVVRCLSARAARHGVPLPKAELDSMAGLAAARARAYYDPARATCSRYVDRCSTTSATPSTCAGR